MDFGPIDLFGDNFTKDILEREEGVIFRCGQLVQRTLLFTEIFGNLKDIGLSQFLKDNSFSIGTLLV